MLCADDTGIVSLSYEGVPRMMADFQKVCKVFDVTVAALEIETTCMPARREQSQKLEAKPAGQAYAQTSELINFGCSLNERPTLIVEVNRRCQLARWRFERSSKQLDH